MSFVVGAVAGGTNITIRGRRTGEIEGNDEPGKEVAAA